MSYKMLLLLPILAKEKIGRHGPAAITRIARKKARFCFLFSGFMVKYIIIT
jgi:hypothetical protein